jgi:hypothetical protein
MNDFLMKISNLKLKRVYFLTLHVHSDIIKKYVIQK